MSRPTAEQALDNAARLLEAAELELTNLPLMERYDELASSWLHYAGLAVDVDRT
ncbi:hypothetical protein ACIGD1_11245 [Streptomyces sp. NPDC085612]|uniref:hypothetical protein n=1 Tax=Streptomyces sp. NPDC085612 TaxID=3365732 RepID=UPI0037CD2301